MPRQRFDDPQARGGGGGGDMTILPAASCVLRCRARLSGARVWLLTVPLGRRVQLSAPRAAAYTFRGGTDALCSVYTHARLLCVVCTSEGFFFFGKGCRVASRRVDGVARSVGAVVLCFVGVGGWWWNGGECGLLRNALCRKIGCLGGKDFTGDYSLWIIN